MGLPYRQRVKDYLRTGDARIKSAGGGPPLLSTEQDRVALTRGSDWDRLVDAYRLAGLTLDKHPHKLLHRLPMSEVGSVAGQRTRCNGTIVRVAEMVTTRQRAETARSLPYFLFENETGMMGVIV